MMEKQELPKKEFIKTPKSIKKIVTFFKNEVASGRMTKKEEGDLWKRSVAEMKKRENADQARIKELTQETKNMTAERPEKRNIAPRVSPNRSEAA